jgi:hypothetical protein
MYNVFMDAQNTTITGTFITSVTVKDFTYRKYEKLFMYCVYYTHAHAHAHTRTCTQTVSKNESTQFKYFY